MVGAVVGILVLLIVSLLLLAPTRYIGLTEVGLVITTLAYSNTSRRKTPSPTSQL